MGCDREAALHELRRQAEIRMCDEDATRTVSPEIEMVQMYAMRLQRVGAMQGWLT